MASNKPIIGYIKLTIPAGQATPAQPVGPALGQKKVRIPDFVRAFNDRTSSMEPGIPIPVDITVYDDGSFDFVTKAPPLSYMILKAAGIEKGNATPGRSAPVASITRAQVSKIAQDKVVDMVVTSHEAAERCVEGAARSMGIAVVS